MSGLLLKCFGLNESYKICNNKLNASTLFNRWMTSSYHCYIQSKSHIMDGTGFAYFRLYQSKNDATCSSQPKALDFTKSAVYHKKAGELIVSIRKGHYKRAKKLVKIEKINVNCYNERYDLPIIDAINRNDVKAIRFIVNVLKANPNISCRYHFNKTPLQFAFENGQIKAARTLLQLGATYK